MKRRLAFIVFGAVALLTATAALSFEPLLRARVRSEAARFGVTLKFDEYALDYPVLTLRGASFERRGDWALRGSAETVSLRLSGLRIESAHVDAARVDLFASLHTALDLAAAGPKAPGLRVTRLTLRWAGGEGESPWLSADAGSFATTAQGAAAAAGMLSFHGYRLGNGSLEWNAAQRAASAHVWLEGLPAGESYRAPTISVRLAQTESALSLGAQVANAPLQTLLRRFDTNAAAQDARLSATLDLAIQRGSASESPGTLSLQLTRFVPAHPRELEGFDFARQTEISMALALSPDLQRARLDDVVLRAGRMALAGSGSVQWQDRAASASLALQGALRCADVIAAARAPESPLRAQQETLTENGPPLPVSVRMAVSSKDFDAADVHAELGKGCGVAR